MQKKVGGAQKKRVYLDYAAATPVHKDVARAMAPYTSDVFGNASAIHAEGQRARDALLSSRAAVAHALRIRKEEVIFTSGGTESNNLALIGVLEHALKTRPLEECAVITTELEHPSIMAVLARYAARGVRILRVPVDSEGRIILTEFRAALSTHVVLITYAYANSEIGVVQDVKALSRIVRQFRKESQKQKGIGEHYPIMHLDASQAPLYLPCGFDSLGVDMMTLDAGKFEGPKGSGVLAKKQYVTIEPLLLGGDQEEGMRPGTEAVGAIVGFAHAFTRAQERWEKRAMKVSALREYAIGRLLSALPHAVLNGSRAHRIANNVNLSIPGIDGEYLAVVLDHHGFAVSTKSACSGLSGSGSKVIYALGGDDARALSTLRITLGEAITKRNIDALTRVVVAHVARMQKFDDTLKK